MNLLGIQMVGLIFGIIFIYLTFLSRKKSELSFPEASFWTIVWFSLIFASLFPGMLSFFVKDLLNVSRTLDFLIIIAFLVIFGVMYYLFIITKKTQNKFESLVRNLALSRKINNRVKKE
jgi:hypothetical protein